MTKTDPLTVTVSAELQERLDAVAQALDRPRSWVIKRALEIFIEAQARQIEEIKRGLAEADAGEFATDVEVAAIFGKWQRETRDAD